MYSKRSLNEAETKHKSKNKNLICVVAQNKNNSLKKNANRTTLYPFCSFDNITAKKHSRFHFWMMIFPPPRNIVYCFSLPLCTDIFVVFIRKKRLKDCSLLCFTRADMSQKCADFRLSLLKCILNVKWWFNDGFCFWECLLNVFKKC